MSDQDKADREQTQLNDAKYAKAVRDNPFYQKMIVTLRAQNIERIGKIRKGKHYEAQLKDEHDTLQNLQRLANVIEHALNDGKIVEDKQRKRLFSKQ